MISRPTESVTRCAQRVREERTDGFRRRTHLLGDNPTSARCRSDSASLDTAGGRRAGGAVGRAWLALRRGARRARVRRDHGVRGQLFAGWITGTVLLAGCTTMTPVQQR